jgi:hypothetical protein
MNQDLKGEKKMKVSLQVQYSHSQNHLQVLRQDYQQIEVCIEFEVLHHCANHKTHLHYNVYIEDFHHQYFLGHTRSSHDLHVEHSATENQQPNEL